MPTPASTDVLLLAALPVELNPVVRALGLRRRGDSWTGELVSASANRLALQAATIGIGAAAAGVAEKWITDAKPALIILAGFAGALKENLQIGDCFEVNEVVTAAQSPIILDSARNAPHLPPARLVTTDRPLTSPQEKHQFHAATGAALVDMETYNVAATLERLRLRARSAAAEAPTFRVLRAVSDRASDTLPADVATWLTPMGRPRPVRIALSFLKSPRNVVRAIRLGRAAKRAGAALAAAVKQVIEAHLKPQ